MTAYSITPEGATAAAKEIDKWYVGKMTSHAETIAAIILRHAEQSLPTAQSATENDPLALEAKRRLKIISEMVTVRGIEYIPQVGDVMKRIAQEYFEICPRCSGEGHIQDKDGDPVLCQTCKGLRRVAAKAPFSSEGEMREALRLAIPFLDSVQHSMGHGHECEGCRAREVVRIAKALLGHAGREKKP